MNPKFIKHLISQGESATVEFKEEIDLTTREGQAEFCKDLMSLANILKTVGKTSYLLIGVSDNGEIKGLKTTLTARQLKDAADLYCQPPVVFRYWQGIVDGKVVGLIIIPQSYRKPHKFKREFSSEKKRFAENSVFTRHLSHVVLASPEEIVALDQEKTELRRRRLMMVLSIAMVALLLACIGIITSGIAYARPIQEFVTLFLPQGIPLLPSGFDPHAMPLVESQIDHALQKLTASPFNAEYASRVVTNEGEFVSLFQFEYRNTQNYRVAMKSNYGLLAKEFGGEALIEVKEGKLYQPDSSWGLKIVDEEIRSPFDLFGYQGLRAPLHHTWIADCSFFSEGRTEYKAWAKLIRLHNRLVRVYERKDAPTKVYCLFMGPNEAKGSVYEKVYIDLETGALLKYEAKGDFQADDKSTLSYEIGFNVTSLGETSN